MAPLVDVLRMVNNERKPAMGCIYAAMRVAKEWIEKTFSSNSSKYKAVFEIIDKRWECQLHHPLHVAGHYLNPEYYYSKPEIETNARLVRGLRKCIETLSESDEVEDLISVQLAQYRGAIDLFAEWWKSYGAETPELQLLAIKVLSLSCSASGCERNWSIFEHIARLGVYLSIIKALVESFEIRDKIDPMEFSKINFHTEWLVGEREKVGDDGEDLVDPNHDLTWTQVADASGANEPLIYTRRSMARR
ncbi:uncharacterized protein LOC131659755 [Vicia villosa]|uniref:uncharacterized protein LOC131659755 n=1 Tax=Vicia villosa TaxID=3911 RepID=UPI00273BE6B0|nr:uncharacterized protein LOC131659755 [Vicia villosa]